MSFDTTFKYRAHIIKYCLAHKQGVHWGVDSTHFLYSNIIDH